MKRLSLILLLCSLALPSARGAVRASDPTLKQALAAANAGKWDDALHLYESVLTEHPEESLLWFDAQMGIAQALAKKGDLDAAAKAAHLCLDGAPTPKAFDTAVTLTASILSAQDKNIARANQFIHFQLSGGADGKPNPLDAVGYPSSPEREKAFALIRLQAGDDANACRLRALTYLFTGKPKDALGQFAEAFRRNEDSVSLPNAGSDLVCIGLRAVRGHRIGLDKAMPFVIFGPAGPDGKTGTADDLTDPFAQLMPPVPAPGSGGLSGMDPEDLEALQKVRDAAQLYAGDPMVPADVRRATVGALQRANDALDGWGAPGQKDWYFRLAFGVNTSPPDDLTAAYVTGAQSAARGRANNYGEVRALWSQIDAICADKKFDLPKRMADAHARFDKMCDGLGQIPFLPPTLTLLTTPATF